MHAFVLFVFYFLTIVNSLVSSVILRTKQGILKGDISRSRSGRTFYSFYGIPYAEPPVGELRFQNPIPAKSWEGIRDATILPPACLSFESDRANGQEDCLYLNVYSPKVTNDAPLLPVIVYIYGGCFMYGNALPDRFGPHYFMDRDVILITFHYRLGIFGFLSTEDEAIPGNYGLKDGVSVLEWVQKYIGDYGGDKNRVTLMGGSSGGFAASLNLISPLAEGLFHRVISQSGFPFQVEKAGKARSGAWKIASSVGCDVETSEALLKCLKTLPAQQLTAYNTKLFTLPKLIPNIPWSPVIENEKVPGAFLVDDPKNLLQRNSNVPWLLGMNSDEGGMFALIGQYLIDDRKSVMDELEANYKIHFPLLFRYDEIVRNDTAELDSITEELKFHYFAERNISQDLRGFSKMFTSLIFPAMIKKSVKLYKGPKYVYHYAHKNQQSFAKMYAGGSDIPVDLGVIHGDELISLFNWSSVITPVTEGVDLAVSQQLIELWTNFAANGDPNPPGEEMVWRPAESSDEFEYLHVENGVFKMKNKLLKEELDFLESVLIDL